MPYAEAEKTRLYYQAIGEGPCILFAHGAGGNAASWWQQQPFFLHHANGHRLITFDQRSYGRSTCSMDDFSPAYFAGDIAAILDAEGVERAALVCQSMGGWGGLAFARQYPDRTAALVMSHTAGGITSDAIRAIQRDARDNMPELDGAVFQLGNVTPFPERNAALANLYNQVAEFNLNDRDAVIAKLMAPEASVAFDALADFTLPTLFVTGDEDVLIPPAVINEAAKAIAGARVVNLGAVGHSSYFEAADQFNAVVGEFLGVIDWD